MWGHYITGNVKYITGLAVDALVQTSTYDSA